MEKPGKKLTEQIMIPEKPRDISSISDIDLEYPDNFKDIKTLSLERLQRTPRLNYWLKVT